MSPAKPVSSFVNKILSPIIEQRAGVSLDLIANWADLVGEEHGRNSRPMRIIWPRDDGSEPGGFVAGTLELSCNPQFALFIQHDSHLILERINTYFGFTAVTKIKLVQVNWKPDADTRSRVKKSPSADMEETLSNMIDCVEDEALKLALRRLGQGVFSRDR